MSSHHQAAAAASSAETDGQASSSEPDDASDVDIGGASQAQSCLELRGPWFEPSSSRLGQSVVHCEPEHTIAASQTQAAMLPQAEAGKACVSPSADEAPMPDAASTQGKATASCQRKPVGELFQQARDPSLPAMQPAQSGSEGPSDPPHPTGSCLLTSTQAAEQPPQQASEGPAEMQPAQRDPQEGAGSMEQLQHLPRVVLDDVIDLLHSDTDGDDPKKPNELQQLSAEACSQRKSRKRRPEPDASTSAGQVGCSIKKQRLAGCCGPIDKGPGSSKRALRTGKSTRCWERADCSAALDQLRFAAATCAVQVIGFCTCFERGSANPLLSATREQPDVH